MSLILDGSVGVSDVDGSAATPAIRGTDANTGMFFPAADTIAFSEGGVESMRIDSAGNVGIGTSSPAYPLDIVSNSGSAVGISLRGQASNIGIASFWSNDGATRYSQIRSASDEFRVQAISAIPITFYTNNAERMRITSAGNVGIGTSSPNTLLEVFGAAGFGYAFSSDQNITRPQGSISLSGANIASTITYTSPGSSTTAGQIYSYASIADNFFRFLDIVSFGSTTGAGSSIRFITGTGSVNTERMRINPTGTISLQGASTTSTGVGITFPATQSASSDANTLDDYEEGTVNLFFSDGTTNSATVTAKYTKIGRICAIRVSLYARNLSALSSSHLRIGGFPFTFDEGNATLTGSISSNFPIMLEVSGGSTTAFLYTGTAAGGNVNSLTKASFQDSTQASVWGWLTYVVQ